MGRLGLTLSDADLELLGMYDEALARLTMAEEIIRDLGVPMVECDRPRSAMQADVDEALELVEMARQMLLRVETVAE